MRCRSTMFVSADIISLHAPPMIAPSLVSKSKEPCGEYNDLEVALIRRKLWRYTHAVDTRSVFFTLSNRWQQTKSDLYYFTTTAMSVFVDSLR